jgi:hypothetical protein
MQFHPYIIIDIHDPVVYVKATRSLDQWTLRGFTSDFCADAGDLIEIHAMGDDPAFAWVRKCRDALGQSNADDVIHLVQILKTVPIQVAIEEGL